MDTEKKDKARTYLMLAAAIALEVTATTCLKLSAGFTVPAPTAAVVVGYAGSLTLLTMVLKHLPLGLAYGVWGGVGTACTVVIGTLLWGDPFTGLSVAGIVLITAGIVLLNRGTEELEAGKREGAASQRA